MLNQLTTLAYSLPIFAAEGDVTAPTAFEMLPTMLVLIAVYTLIGMLLFGLCIFLIVKIAPFSVQKEIEEDQNTSLGIIMGSLILGIALILAAAIHG